MVYCSNHQSNVDPPILFHALHPCVRILYKREIDRDPGADAVVPHGRLHPGRPRQQGSGHAVDRGGRAVDPIGHSFLIFPEGTRSKTDELLPFKKGGFIMAIKAQAPIVPVAVQGGREAMQRGSWIIRPVTVSIRVGEPIETAGLGREDRDPLIARVRGDIETLLASRPDSGCVVNRIARRLTISSDL